MVTAILKRILGRANRTSHHKSGLTNASSSSDHDHETPKVQSPQNQVDAKLKKSVSTHVLITGLPGAGCNVLGLRLGNDMWIDHYFNPTGDRDYRKGHQQPDGRFVMLEYSAIDCLSPDRGYVALWDHVLHGFDIFLLVYRVDDNERIKCLEDVYATYILPRHPPAVQVCIIATCADLLPPDGTGRELVDQGQALAEKYGLGFHLVSPRTAEGCRELEASLITAALKAHDAGSTTDPRPGTGALNSST